MKKTRWFPGDVKPARPGWYETRWFWEELTRKWFDGTGFLDGPDDNLGTYYRFDKTDKWRGLAEKPE